MHLRSCLTLLVAAAITVPLAAQQKKQSTSSSTSAVPAAVQRSLDDFNANAMRAHVKFLSSDLLEGRGPGTRGDQLAMQYIATQFQLLGLKPDGDNGTYFQKVALLGVTLDPAKSSISFAKDGGSTIGPLKYLDEWVGGDQTQNTSSVLDSEMVFVGHGVTAPEYKWDDYKGLDTRGKTLVMLVDDPPANAGEPDLFKGKARTYYGRWTYKYEQGAAKGAQAVILIHTTPSAGYGWEVVRNSWGRERSYVKNAPNSHQLNLAGWMTQKVAADLFKAAGQDLDALMKAAASRDFKPVSLGFRLKGGIGSGIRTLDTANVVAKIEGSDPQLKKEAVLYTAHHDHLGIHENEPGDNIYNGAVDNATGIAILLDLARVWSKASPKPKRSIIFASVTAEEQGLLGSEWFGRNPTIPAGRIALNLNFDAFQQWGRVGSMTMNGVERTTFLPTAQKVTKALGLTISPDPAPEQGHYYRSDHFSLGKVGIPAFSVDQGEDVIGKPEGWGRKMADDYNEKRYHQPGDQYEESWDFSSSQQVGQLGFWLGWEAANAPTMPNWLPGDEFRATRDKSLGEVK